MIWNYTGQNTNFLVGNDRVFILKGSGILNATYSKNIRLLIAAAGGSHGNKEYENTISSAGGGGGELIENNSKNISQGSHSISIGVGGGEKQKGGNTTAFGHTANGGGCGYQSGASIHGGSGGGGADGAPGNSAKLGNGLGNKGGNGLTGNNLARPSPGGGGGAGGPGGNAGANGVARDGGDGGAPHYSNITGVNRPYCAGGRGGYSFYNGDSTRGNSGAMQDSDYGRGGYANHGLGYVKTSQNGVVIIRVKEIFNISLTRNNTNGVISNLSGSSLSGSKNVTATDNSSFTITPNENFYISSLIIDGQYQNLTNSQRQGMTYTFNNVTDDHSIVAKFSEKPIITTSTNGNGNITPNSPHINYGSSQTFFIEPNPGNVLTSLKVNGNQIDITNNLGMSYTMNNIVDDATIEAVFKSAVGNTYYNFL